MKLLPNQHKIYEMDDDYLIEVGSQSSTSLNAMTARARNRTVKHFAFRNLPAELSRPRVLWIFVWSTKAPPLCFLRSKYLESVESTLCYFEILHRNDIIYWKYMISFQELQESALNG